MAIGLPTHYSYPLINPIPLIRYSGYTYPQYLHHACNCTSSMLTAFMVFLTSHCQGYSLHHNSNISIIFISNSPTYLITHLISIHLYLYTYFHFYPHAHLFLNCVQPHFSYF